jgi:hypothetical protein
VHHSKILRNSFYATGDSAILVVGASGRHRTNNAKSLDYPYANVIEANHVDTVGVWGKQSAAYFKAVTRANRVRNNVFHDGPRSGINFNDGFAGGEVMEGNLLFNYVKESNDHGPFNSWDRQPYVTRKNESDLSDGAELQISPDVTNIRANMIFNYNFHPHGSSCGSVTVDLDDESSQFNITSNVLLYGGIKNFDGMDRNNSNNLVIYPGVQGGGCYDALQANRNISSGHSHFFNNHCVMSHGHYPYNCGAGPAPFYNETYHIQTHGNIFSYAGADPGYDDWGGACRCWPKSVPCAVKTFADWQALGHDTGSKIQTELTNTAIIAEARALLASVSF